MLVDHQDLEMFLGRDVGPLRGAQVIDLASGIVRSATGQTFTPPTETSILWRNTADRRLFLPHPTTGPVTVDTVTVDGEPFTDFHLDRFNILTRTDDGRWFGDVEVTYTHGAEEAPEAVKAVTLAVAVRLFNNADGVTQKSIGDVSISYGRAQAGPSLTEWERSTLDAFRYPAMA